jgi:two-component system, NtrC family, sensor histidine kinase PilS
MRKLVGALASGTKRAESLVTQLLGLAEAGQKTVDATDVDLDEVVRRVLDEHRGEIDEGARDRLRGQAGVDPRRRDTRLPAFLQHHRERHKHNDNPTPIVRVRQLEPPDGMHTFAVCDNGGGIPTDDLERIFDPFFKSEEGGTGIGLATAERIVKVYCGYIRAYNDSGACFEFALKDYPEDRAF